MLGTCIFSFSHIVFYSSKNKFQFFIHILLSSANAFNFDQFNILSFGKELNAYHSYFTEIVNEYKNTRSMHSTSSQNHP